MYDKDFKATWTASSRAHQRIDDYYHPKLVLDNDYTVSAYLAPKEQYDWLQIDFGATIMVRQVRLYPGTKG